MEILLDDTKRLHFKRVFFASAFNLPYEGGGCKFCPDAKPDDDLLDFIVIANVPKIIALAILPTVFSGKHTRLPGVHIFRCKKAEVHSKIALPVHSDGEPIYLQKDVSFSLEPETLKIITKRRGLFYAVVLDSFNCCCMFFLIFIYDHAEYFPSKQNPPLSQAGLCPSRTT